MTLYVPLAFERSVDVSLSITTSDSTTDGVDISNFPYGSIDIPSGSSITTITWHGAGAGEDSDSVPITQTVAADGTFELPPALAGFKVIYPVGDAAGTATLHLKRSA